MGNGIWAREGSEFIHPDMSEEKVLSVFLVAIPCLQKHVYMQTS